MQYSFEIISHFQIFKLEGAELGSSAHRLVAQLQQSSISEPFNVVRAIRDECLQMISRKWGCLLLVAALGLERAVIEAKHRAYRGKLESEKVEPLSRRDWMRSVRDTQTPESQMSESDIRWMGNLMFRQGQQDHDPVSQMGVKIEEHRKLMRYEQRVVNQIRKAAHIKK